MEASQVSRHRGTASLAFRGTRFKCEPGPAFWEEPFQEHHVNVEEPQAVIRAGSLQRPAGSPREQAGGGQRVGEAGASQERQNEAAASIVTSSGDSTCDVSHSLRTLDGTRRALHTWLRPRVCTGEATDATPLHATALVPGPKPGAASGPRPSCTVRASDVFLFERTPSDAKTLRRLCDTRVPLFSPLHRQGQISPHWAAWICGETSFLLPVNAPASV